VTLTFRHRYSSLCKYVVRLMVANALGVDEVLLGVSVERPILRATMTVTNVKLLGQPTTFTFNVTTAPVIVEHLRLGLVNVTTAPAIVNTSDWDWSTLPQHR